MQISKEMDIHQFPDLVVFEGSEEPVGREGRT